MNTWIIFTVGFMQTAEVFEHLCAICSVRLPNVRYQHDTRSHLAVCSDCDAEHQNALKECPVCRQVITDRERISEGEKRALKRKIQRAKHKEQTEQEASALRLAQEEKDKADQAKREEEERKDRDSKALSLSTQALELMQNGDFKSSELPLIEALRLDPENLYLSIQYGYLLLRLGRFDEGITHYDMIVASWGDLADHDTGLILVAERLVVLGFYDHAVNYLARIQNLKAIDMIPAASIAYHVVMGHINLQHLHKYGLAKKHYMKASSVANTSFGQSKYAPVVQLNGFIVSRSISNTCAQIQWGLKTIDEQYAKEVK